MRRFDTGRSGDEVHLWSITLRPGRGGLQYALALLSADERARAARFHFPVDRERYALSRATLRAILGAYLDVSPDTIRLRNRSHGKPELAGDYRAGVRFNLSHSGDQVLIAVSPTREVGVDLDWIRPLRDVEGMARRYFSAAEAAAVRAVPSASKFNFFFALWTLKEAYLKATGRGLSLPLDRFEVLHPAIREVLPITLAEPGASATQWSLRPLDAGPGFAAALAVEGHGWWLVHRNCASAPDLLS